MKTQKTRRPVFRSGHVHDCGNDLRVKTRQDGRFWIAEAWCEVCQRGAAAVKYDERTAISDAIARTDVDA